MKQIIRIASFQVQDALRSKWLILHGLFYLLVSEGLLLAAGTSVKAVVSLVNVVLLLVPLVSLVFGVMQLYHAREFILLLLTQPLRRRDLFLGLYAGLSVPLAATFALGTALPFLWHGAAMGLEGLRLTALLAGGVLLTLLFSALAFLVAVRHTDRVKGIGLALLYWLGFAVIFDGIVLVAVSMFASWPLEKILLGVMFLNPIDLVRVVMLMLFDAAALMGYTGAIFSRFFGSAPGVVVATLALMIWTVIPLLLAQRAFVRRDF